MQPRHHCRRAAHSNFTEGASTNDLPRNKIVHANFGTLEAVVFALLMQYLLLDYFLFLLGQAHDLHLLLQLVPGLLAFTLLIFCLGILVLDIGLGTGSFLAGLARRLQFDFDLWMTIGARLRCLLHLLLGTVRVYPVGPIGRVRRCDSLFLLHVLSWSNMVVDTYECGTVFNLLERRVQNEVTLLKNGLFEL